MEDDFDFDKLAHLAKTDQNAFEIERMRLIGNCLAAMPEKQRTENLARQYRLDMMRETMGAGEYLDYLSQEMVNSMHNLVDAMNGLLETFGARKPVVDLTPADPSFTIGKQAK
jgi:hypothetical protein